MFDWLESARARPVWEQMPAAKRGEMRLGLPSDGVGLDEIYADFQRLVLPYGAGNEHPRFFGWVNGGGTAAGILAELLVAVFNPNCGGRDHAAIEVERQVIAWAAEAMGFPKDAGGVLITGSSMANMVRCWWRAGRRWARPCGRAAWKARGCAPIVRWRRMAAFPARWTWPAWAPTRCG
jgi:glutamate/tyrosine decarboxylase-like PLP-dependent enzyme